MENKVRDGRQIFRVDRFKVPAQSRAEFLERSRSTHELLRSLPGFVEDFFLESPTDDGSSKIVTIVVWRDAAAFDAAKIAAHQHYQKVGFHPGEVLKLLGIEADMAAYTELKS